MNIKRVCICVVRNISVFHRINIPFRESNSNIVVMQKSLLSFFKPLTEKSQINRDDGPKKNEQKSTNSSPKDEKKEKTSLKGSSEKNKKEPEETNHIFKQEKNELQSTKRSQETEDNKLFIPSPKIEKPDQKSPNLSPKEKLLKEETPPVVQKKRKRIIAFESDSDGEVSQDAPRHEKKKEALERNESMEKKDDIIHQKLEAVLSSESEERVEDGKIKKEEGAFENNEPEKCEKKDAIEKEEKALQNSDSENQKKDDSMEKKNETVVKKKIETKKKKTTPKRQTKKQTKTKKEVKSKTVVKNEEDSDIVWKKGEKTPYLYLAKTLQKVEETSARLKIIDILAEYFQKIILTNKADLLPSIYLCLNTLGPAYEGVELGIADTYLMKAVAQCTGRSLAQIKTDVAKIGDLGIVAEQSRSNQKLMFRPAALTVQGVFQQLSDIAKISGQNAVKRKIDKIQALFVSCQECEARFIIRSLAGKLRIGLAEQSVIQALALACTTTPPNQNDPPAVEDENDPPAVEDENDPPAVEDASKTVSLAEFKKRAEEELLILKTTYCECPNFNLIVPALFEHGIRELPKFCKVTPGIPIKPMLAHPTKGVHEVFQRFEDIKFTCEWKYDGERAQIHLLEDGSIRIYSRNQEDNTSKYPDIIDNIRQSFKSAVKSCIIDTESVAWDREQRKIMPFQILSTRKRKDADVTEIKVRVCVFFFDLLYLNGESLTQKPLSERRTLLKEHFQEVDHKFSFVTSMDANTMEEVQEFLDDSVKGNCEGLMVKTLETEATYEIAKRSRNWLKLKKDYLDGCGDTLDLVVIGGYVGKGKRTGQYGGFLLASYDADNDEYQTICKIGTGFTEEALAKHSDFLKQYVIEKAKPYYRYDESHEPDFWFDAVVVWEVKCADLSLSPIYYSGIGLVDPDKGISLRFPRFLRIREDKTVEQATSSQQVADLYKNQDQIKNNASANESKFNEEDF